MSEKPQKLILPSLITDGMILQRNRKIKIWGWSQSREKVKVIFKEKEYLTAANAEGEWSLFLPAQKAGGPFEMRIAAAAEEITVSDILIGEVWLCSGQSNMELPIRRVKDKYAEEIKNAQNDQIREFKIPITYNFKQENEDIEGAEWSKLSQNTILDFSAAAYFFAKKLQAEYQVPVGILNASVGGSPVEAWMSRESLADYPQYLKKADKYSDPEVIREAEKYNLKINLNWARKIKEIDTGLNNEIPYYEEKYDDQDWKKVEIPTKFDQIDFENKNGIVWFRKEINLTASQAKKEARLWLGRIVDADKAYLNGQMVGATTYKYPPRKYELKAGSLKAGKNIIALRVVVNDGQGEFVADKPYKLFVGDSEIDLRGEWKYKIAAEIKEDKKEEIFIQWQPTGLFNGMIAPLLNYEIKGICWYQGESNTGREEEYKDLFSKMIRLWRNRFGSSKLPFIYAQLPNFEPPEANDREIWAAFRNAQRDALSLENTAMTVNLDLGEWNDLHPLNKKDVAHRFYLAARNLAYGEDIVYSGPQFKSAVQKESKIFIKFDLIDGGLKIKGDNLKGFELAGADKNFKEAAAAVENNKVLIWNEEIDKPEYFRYSWRDNPVEANLHNQLDLPAGTFLEKL
ncbi:MAG: sialate O-acetylesterase [Halanaerobium sp.]